jgi:hypothetical protein
MARQRAIANSGGEVATADKQMPATIKDRAARDPREALAYFGVAEEAVAKLRTVQEMYEALASALEKSKQETLMEQEALRITKRKHAEM